MASQWARLGLSVSGMQKEQITRYTGMLHHWNRRINLTGARTLDELWRRHVLDCLMLSTVPEAGQPCHWLDVGSGAGLPGLILAILYPRSRITAVETVAKKATFLDYAIAELGLENASVFRRDVNEMTHDLAHDTVEPSRDRMVARAFAPLPVLLRLAPRLLGPAGELWAMKGERWREEVAQADPADLAPFLPEPGLTPYRLQEQGPGGIVLVYRLGHHGVSGHTVERA